MTATYLFCFIAGVIGVAIHILVKLQSLKKKAKAGNAQFSVRGYFCDDWIAITISLLVVCAFVYILSDQGVQHYRDWYTNWPRLVFTVIGYAGNDLATSFFGLASEKINKVIDVKTDLADGKIKND